MRRRLRKSAIAYALVHAVGLIPAFAAADGGKEVAQSAIVFEVTDVEEAARGRVLCMLYDSEKTWLQKPLRTVQAIMAGNKGVCSFSEVALGTYAVGVLHDLDGDGDMDTNFLGIPKEGYCASRNARGRMSAPAFSDARFEYKGGVVRLQARMIN